MSTRSKRTAAVKSAESTARMLSSGRRSASIATAAAAAAGATSAGADAATAAASSSSSSSVVRAKKRKPATDWDPISAGDVDAIFELGITIGAARTTPRTNTFDVIRGTDDAVLARLSEALATYETNEGAHEMLCLLRAVASAEIAHRLKESESERNARRQDAAVTFVQVQKMMDANDASNNTSTNQTKEKASASTSHDDAVEILVHRLTDGIDDIAKRITPKHEADYLRFIAKEAHDAAKSVIGRSATYKAKLKDVMKALDEYARDGYDDCHTEICTLMEDLRPWCNRNGVDVGEQPPRATAAAAREYDSELDEPNDHHEDDSDYGEATPPGDDNKVVKKSGEPGEGGEGIEDSCADIADDDDSDKEFDARVEKALKEDADSLSRAGVKYGHDEGIEDACADIDDVADHTSDYGDQLRGAAMQIRFASRRLLKREAKARKLLKEIEGLKSECFTERGARGHEPDYSLGCIVRDIQKYFKKTGTNNIASSSDDDDDEAAENKELEAKVQETCATCKTIVVDRLCKCTVSKADSQTKDAKIRASLMQQKALSSDDVLIHVKGGAGAVRRVFRFSLSADATLDRVREIVARKMFDDQPPAGVRLMRQGEFPPGVFAFGQYMEKLPGDTKLCDALFTRWTELHASYKTEPLAKKEESPEENKLSSWPDTARYCKRLFAPILEIWLTPGYRHAPLLAALLGFDWHGCSYLEYAAKAHSRCMKADERILHKDVSTVIDTPAGEVFWMIVDRLRTEHWRSVPQPLRDRLNQTNELFRSDYKRHIIDVPNVLSGLGTAEAPRLLHTLLCGLIKIDVKSWSDYELAQVQQFVACTYNTLHTSTTYKEEDVTSVCQLWDALAAHANYRWNKMPDIERSDPNLELDGTEHYPVPLSSSSSSSSSSTTGSLSMGGKEYAMKQSPLTDLLVDIHRQNSTPATGKVVQSEDSKDGSRSQPSNTPPEVVKRREEDAQIMEIEAQRDPQGAPAPGYATVRVMNMPPRLSHTASLSMTIDRLRELLADEYWPSVRDRPKADDLLIIGMGGYIGRDQHGVSLRELGFLPGQVVRIHVTTREAHANEVSTIVTGAAAAAAAAPPSLDRALSLADQTLAELE